MQFIWTQIIRNLSMVWHIAMLRAKWMIALAQFLWIAFFSWLYIYARAFLVFSKIVQKINSYWFRVHRTPFKQEGQSFWSVYHYLTFFFFPPFFFPSQFLYFENLDTLSIIQAHLFSLLTQCSSRCIVDLFVVNRKNPNFI